MTGSLAEENGRKPSPVNVAAVLQDAGGKYKKALLNLQRPSLCRPSSCLDPGPLGRRRPDSFDAQSGAEEMWLQLSA
jgi:hypothetical protein